MSSLRRSSSGYLSASSNKKTLEKSPAKRPVSARSISKSISARSSSQASNVSDVLNVTSVGSIKKSPHKRGNSLKSVPVSKSPNSKLTKSFNNNSSKRKQNVNRPAWSLTSPNEADLNGFDSSSDVSSSVGVRPSIEDFLENSEIYSNNEKSNTTNKNPPLIRNSLLEFLSCDTARTNATNQTDDTSQSEPQLNDTERSDTTIAFEKHEKRFQNENIVNLSNIDDDVVSWGSKGSNKYNSRKNFNSKNEPVSNKLRLGKEKSHKQNILPDKNELIKSRTLTNKKQNKNNSNFSKQSYISLETDFNFNKLSLASQSKLLNLRREVSAKIIQKWWCKIELRRKTGNAAMKRMMESKRNEIEERLNKEREKEYEKQLEEYEEMRRREEQERLYRQEILTQMKTKREEKKSKPIKFMSSSGKLSKRTQSELKKKKQETKDVENIEERPNTSSSIGRKVDEIFESSYQDSNSERTDATSPTSTLKNETITSSIIEPQLRKEEKKATLDDLFTSLKELEKDDHVTNGHYNDSYEADYNSKNFSKDNNLDTGEPMQNNYLSADKLKNIMSFLDEVEKIEEDVRTEVLSSKEFYNASTYVSDDVISPSKDTYLESASQVATDISQAITAQKLEIDEKKRTLDMMQKTMKQQKEFTTMQMKEMDKEHKQQLSIQRQEYESTIQRHLSFIDQLIDDKKVLTKRCEDLVAKLKDIDQKFSAKLKHTYESHAAELKKQKEISDTAEKMRREKWIKEKTKEIKELTVKGLEPDIQRLIAKHKAEIKKIKAEAQGDIIQADERVGKKYLEQMDELRIRLEKEKDTAVKKERELAREKFEIQLREEENLYQQQRRRLYQEIEQEKEQCNNEIQKLKKEYDEKKSLLESSCKQMIEDSQIDCIKQVEDLKCKHEDELKNLKEKYSIEKEQWIENYMKKQETYLLTKERELKDGVKESRDREIEMVIQRLEQETALNREELEKAAENRVKRIREKYEREIQDYESTEKTLQTKCNTLREQAEEKENECLLLKSERKRIEQELNDLRQLTQRLQDERGKVSDIIRQEFADRLVVLEEDGKRLRRELSEEKARHRFEVERITKDKEHELDEVHKRVKQAITKKEETTKMLRQQMNAAEKRAEHLEQLLAEQRKKILSS